MREVGKQFLGKLRFEAPRATGEGIKSFKVRTYESARGLELRVMAAPHMVLQATGSKRKNYPITPKAGVVLAMKKMEVIGPFAARQVRVVFRKKVFRHPGVRANAYHERAVRGFRPEWDSLWRKMAVRVVTRLAGKGV